MIMTSHGSLGKSKGQTGTWLEEVAAPYYTFLWNGATVVMASPAGGQPPVDPKSEGPEFQTSNTKRFVTDPVATRMFANTVKLGTVQLDDYDAVFYPGGHGPLWDLVDDIHSISLLKHALLPNDNKPVALVCHGPAVLRWIKRADGHHVINNRSLTGFSNSEEQAVGLTDTVPFLLEDMLKDNGAHYSKAREDWGVHVVTDGMLITGQNPASSEATAEALIRLLKKPAGKKRSK